MNATCETHGHIFGAGMVCVFCRATRPTSTPTVAELTEHPTIDQRTVGANWVRLYAADYAHDPAFVAAAVWRIMALAVTQPNAVELQGLRGEMQL